MNLEKTRFNLIDELIVEIFKSDKALYLEVEKDLLLIKRFNSMLLEVKDSKVKNIIEKNREESINNVLCITDSRK